MMTMAAALPAGRGRTARASDAIVLWLGLCAAMVFAMCVIGAITRLTESGLSITEWKPVTGVLPPLSQEAWQRAFDLYRETPEYRLRNLGMDLAGFKQIYFWEWLHRLWGRLIGLVFALPLLWFWLSGRVPAGWTRRLAAVLLLGGLQGAMGWFMVQSGLVDRPSVSHYRLAAHLGLAILIYAVLVWFVLSLRPPHGAMPAAPSGLRRHARAGLALLAVTMLWGAFVAGLDAGAVYNTFPLMDGRVVPPAAFSIVPAWLNAFENTALVQFIHRWLAIGTAVVLLGLAWRSRGRPGGWLLAGAVLVQVGLGIAALLAAVPVTLGALHQAGALLVLTALLIVMHRQRGG